MSAVNQQGRLQYYVGEPSETTRRISHIQALAILLGILYTDGCVSPKGNSWRIYFSNKSVSLIALFRDCIMAAFAAEQPRVRVGTTTDGLYKAVVDSKTIGAYLVANFGTFRTLKFGNGELPLANLPISFLRLNQQTEIFMQAAFSCDGGLCFYPATRSGKYGGTKWLIRTVFLACAHPKLRADYVGLLNNLGIRAREASADGKIKIETEKDIRLFAERIGFVPGTLITLHSKYWNGYEKNEVLKLMIDSYRNPSSFYQLPRFVR
jgi:hypothetical protein